MAQVASVAGSVLCSGSKTTQRQRDVCQGMHVDEEQIYLTYGRTHNTEARWRNWVGSRKRHNGPGDIVAEMKKQKPARPGEGLPECRQACRLSRVSRPFRMLREGTGGRIGDVHGGVEARTIARRCPRRAIRPTCACAVGQGRRRRWVDATRVGRTCGLGGHAKGSRDDGGEPRGRRKVKV